MPFTLDTLKSQLLKIGRDWKICSAEGALQNLQPDNYNWVQHGFASRDGWMHPNAVVHLVVVYVVHDTAGDFYKIGQTSTHERPVLARILEQKSSSRLRLVGLAVCAQRRRDTGHSYRASRPNHDTTMRNALLLEGAAVPIAYGSEIEWVRFPDHDVASSAIVQHCGQRGHAWLPARDTTDATALETQFISTRIGGNPALSTADPHGEALVVARAVHEPQQHQAHDDASPSTDGSVSGSAITYTAPTPSDDTESTTAGDGGGAGAGAASAAAGSKRRRTDRSLTDSENASTSTVHAVHDIVHTLYGKVIKRRPNATPLHLQPLDVITITGVNAQQNANLSEFERSYILPQGKDENTTWVGIVCPIVIATGFHLLYKDRSGDMRFTHIARAAISLGNLTYHGTMSENDFNDLLNQPNTRPSEIQDLKMLGDAEESSSSSSLESVTDMILKLRLRPPSAPY